MPWRRASGLGGHAAAVDAGHDVHARVVAGGLERLARHALEADAREVLVEVAAVDRVGALARLEDHARDRALALAGGVVAGVGGELERGCDRAGSPASPALGPRPPPRRRRRTGRTRRTRPRRAAPRARGRARGGAGDDLRPGRRPPPRGAACGGLLPGGPLVAGPRGLGALPSLLSGRRLLGRRVFGLVPSARPPARLLGPRPRLGRRLPAGALGLGRGLRRRGPRRALAPRSGAPPGSPPRASRPRAAGALPSSGVNLHRLWLLRGVRVVRPGVDLQLAQLRAAQPGARQHALHGEADDLLGPRSSISSSVRLRSPPG